MAHISWEGSVDGDYTLRLNFRRALIDAKSLDMIRFDFALLLSGLPPLERVGFTSYHRYLRKTKDFHKSRAFWARTLEGIAPASTLTTREGGWPAETRPRQSVTAMLDGLLLHEQSSCIHDIGSSRRTFFELLWALVISEHTASEDIVFGTVGRDNSFAWADSYVGCLDQTYLLRVGISHEHIVKNVAAAIDAYHVAAANHTFLGLNDIRRYLPSHNQVESVLNYTQSPNPQCIAPGLNQFPILMTVCDSRLLQLTLTYVDDIPKRHAEIMLSHFVTAILNASSNLGLRNGTIGNIDLISDEERSSILLGGPPAPPQINPPTLPVLFEMAASRHPSRTAVIFENKTSITFGELNALANRLARVLQLRRGAIVPLLMDRSVNLVATIFAVLKSGAAYTVLNADVPRERNIQVISECAPAVILADQRYVHMLPNARSIEDYLAEATQLDDKNMSVEGKATPEDLCYIIYTSGSTGKPKGTMITHRAAVNGIVHHQSLDSMPRCLLFYSPTASAAQRTFISTLIHGGTVVLASKENLASDVVSVINNYQVDVMEITPTALSLLRPSEIPRIKQITIAGESIPEALVNTWAANDKLIVRNRYGSSECTQMSLGRRLRPKDNPRVLGRPMDTTLAYILRLSTTQLAPTGAVGELCLAGPQLSVGYLNEPELTAEVFIENPFGEGKLYRTGDKARRLADGSIEILGRIDWQVKIRGNKVEPADVDHAMSAQKDLLACATFAADVGGYDLVLVAAVVPVDGVVWGKLLPSLRQHALSTLPSFMVPSMWLPLAQLPKNVNGKVDFHKLRKTARELGVAGFAKIMASGDEGELVIDDTEVKIARVWAGVIGIDRDTIRRHHSFLALGGNSLQAIKTISQLRREYKIVVEFSSLLTDEPLEYVASTCTIHVDSNTTEVEPFGMVDSFSSQLRGGEMEIVDAYPATPLQAGLLSTINKEGDPYTYRRLWNINGLDVARLRASFLQVISERDIFNTGFIPYKRSFIQVVRADLAFPWQETHDSLEAYLERDKKIDLPTSGPLFRIGLVRGMYLVITMHHSLCDFWSHGFLYKDVAAAYLGKAVRIRPRFRNFVQHIVRQDTPATHKFWAKYLEGLPRSSGRLNYAPIGQTTVISKEVHLNLRQRTTSLGITLGAAIYSAWAIVLSHHLGSNDVSFAITISGREVPVHGVENMDGPTVTTVPQRVKLDQGQTLIQLVKAVTRHFIQVTKHSQVGMQGALRAGGLQSDSIDSLVNILVKSDDNEDEDEDVRRVFKRHGDRPIWSAPYTLLEVEPGETGAEVRMSSDMEPQRLEFLCDSFVKVLTTMVLDQPEQHISTIDILGDAEQLYLLNRLSGRETLRVPPPQFLHAEFERCVRANPDTVAIDWDAVRDF
jgi:amino acid adenylation domain-containing protein